MLVDGVAAGTDLIRNAIFHNGKLPINLRPAGEPVDAVSPNDAGDADTGPNAVQNFPVIAAAIPGGRDLRHDGHHHHERLRRRIVERDRAVDLSGQRVRATATRTDLRDTSELSAARTVG